MKAQPTPRLRVHIENAVAAVGCSFEAFVVACLVVIIWAATGPHFGYSDTWQLIINTGTTIVTFLMAFLIGANQRRSDVVSSVMLKLLEQHVKLIESHTDEWEKNQQETHRLLCDVHALTCEMHERTMKPKSNRA